jgi:hypothetical protein
VWSVWSKLGIARSSRRSSLRSAAAFSTLRSWRLSRIALCSRKLSRVLLATNDAPAVRPAHATSSASSLFSWLLAHQPWAHVSPCSETAHTKRRTDEEGPTRIRCGSLFPRAYHSYRWRFMLPFSSFAEEPSLLPSLFSIATRCSFFLVLTNWWCTLMMGLYIFDWGQLHDKVDALNWSMTCYGSCYFSIFPCCSRLTQTKAGREKYILYIGNDLK